MQRLSNLWDRLDSFMWNTVYAIKNLYLWFPIIIRQRDWDYVFLLKLIQFKLELMIKSNEYSTFEDKEKIKYQMTMAKSYITLLIEDDGDEVQMRFAMEQFITIFKNEKTGLFGWWN